mmetsp:Transcript_3001/g.2482  ORF Transcript_3001/g.2482 Transcript_3001/m.2482 type:complete len:255 (-) Transcript_3001:13-777(-)
MKGIPEENYSTQNLIRRRRRNEDVNRKREEGRVKDVMMSQRRNKQGVLDGHVKDPEFFAKNYRKQQRSYVIYKRKKDAVMHNEAAVERKEGSSILALRVKDEKNCSKQENGMLARCKLTRKHNASFIENTIGNLKMLKKIENYVVYGQPSKTLIEDLLKFRGFAKVNDKRVPLSDNNIIEEALGDLDIICVEDIVANINKNENLERINKFIYTFTMSSNKKMDAKYARDKTRVFNGRLGEKKSTQLDKIIRAYF